jgi:hypothetical protein
MKFNSIDFLKLEKPKYMNTNIYAPNIPKLPPSLLKNLP